MGEVIDIFTKKRLDTPKSETLLAILDLQVEQNSQTIPREQLERFASIAFANLSPVQQASFLVDGDMLERNHYPTFVTTEKEIK
jgi:hypothetical protein